MFAPDVTTDQELIKGSDDCVNSSMKLDAEWISDFVAGEISRICVDTRLGILKHGAPLGPQIQRNELSMRLEMDIEKIEEELAGSGYVVVEDVFDSALLCRLETASYNVWDKVRSGTVDVAGMGPDAGAIFGLMAPEFEEPVFGEHFLAPNLMQVVEAFLGFELRLGYVHLRNARDTYDTGWHRDVGGTNRDLGHDDELALLNKPHNSFRWQLALMDDPCLWLVPGSHKRYRTEEERHALVTDKHVELSGMKNVVLKRGQTLFWDGNTIHRGIMPSSLKERLVLAGGLCRYFADEPKMEMDRRFAWRIAENIGPALPAQVRVWWERWLDLQEESEAA